MLTGSLYVADSLETGVAISGYKNTGFIRSLGYEGFTAGFPGFLIWSGSALSGSAGTKGGVPYSGVGLELYADANNYFRYSTNPSELDVHTKTFFLGDPATQYISGSNGNLEISSSGFYLTAQGNVTASSFVAVNSGVTLFDSNNQFADGYNIGRVVYFNRTEYTVTSVNINTTPQTASIFETFILPGETRMQLSVSSQFNNQAVATATIRATFYIQSASNTAISPGANDYDTWSTPESITFAPGVDIITAGAGTIRGNARTINCTTGTVGLDVFANYQGKYSRIYMIIADNSAGSTSSVVKMKNFVYRTSRVTGGATVAPATPIK
jgi:hypothetical protein